MKHRRSRIRLSPGAEKLIVVFFLALLLFGVVALFASIGDADLPWLQPEEELPGTETEKPPSTDISPPEDDGGSDTGDNDGWSDDAWTDDGWVDLNNDYSADNEVNISDLFPGIGK